MKQIATHFLLFLALSIAVLPSAWASRIVIASGTLSVSGRLAADALTIGDSGTLSGDGAVAAATTIAGTISPGTAGDIAVLRFTDDVTFEATSRFQCDLQDDDTADRIECSQQITGSATVQISGPESAVPVGLIISVGAGSSNHADFELTPASSLRYSLSATPRKQLKLTESTSDTDTDGLPDWWELTYFASRTAGDATLDSDVDGTDNLSEYIAGTLPTNSTSLFALLQATNVNSTTTLTWSSSDDRFYSIYVSTNLSADAGVALTNGIAGQPPTQSVSISHSNPTAAYFWVEVSR